MRCRLPGSAVPPGRAEPPPAVPVTPAALRRTSRSAPRTAVRRALHPALQPVQRPALHTDPRTGLPSTTPVRHRTPWNTDQAGRPSA
ncbi:hypothetical protein [Streptomyces sp. NRRL B-24484]|uniref:hypothetical protein n=1 Tax=Streptomyces sp. NRRL B-24484 TaxID=1463833 RepID=UPI0004BFF560|nr:hypothetical protein [Streptomyces sp. NRRL B-24484]